MMSQRLDRPLQVWIRVSIHLHRLACRFCDNYRRHLDLIRGISNEFQFHLHELRDDQLPAEAKARIKKAVLQDFFRPTK